MKKYTTDEVAATIDHAVLKPAFTNDDVIENARDVREAQGEEHVRQARRCGAGGSTSCRDGR